MMQIQPYLFFEGRCDEAIEFYRTALGAEVTTLMRYKDGPAPCPSGAEDKVLHASLRIQETTIYVSDGRCGGKAEFQGFALSLTVPGREETERLFAALANGGQIHAPLAATFFSPRFGMVADRFGVLWIVYARQA